MPEPIPLSSRRRKPGVVATPPAPVVLATRLPERLPRDPRIDVLRGLALVMIFINHVPGTVYESLTSRNFGFSDAAEGFVLMAGISAALAYAGGLGRRPLWPGVARIWARAWLLYLVQLLLVVWALAIAGGMDRLFGIPTMLERDNFQMVNDDTLGLMIGLAMTTHQFGYINILPLYAVLLLAAPALIIAAGRWPLRVLAGSLAVWALAGIWMIDLPNYPGPGGWFFNPLAWQLLFVTGILVGLALRRREALVPRSRLLFWAAVAYLLFALVWIKIPPVASVGNEVMAALGRMGLPPLIRDFDKTYVALPRLLHILSLAYVLGSLPLVSRLSRARAAAPLALMGRNALPVFALGTILAFLAQACLLLLGDDFLISTLLIATGLGLQVAFALLRDRSRALARQGGGRLTQEPLGTA